MYYGAVQPQYERISYRTRDLGYGSEEDVDVLGHFTGEHDPSGAGKLAFETWAAGTLWLFEDEITDREPAEKPQDVAQLLEEPPKGCFNIASLWSWSSNYETQRGPATLFLDLIGWWQDEMGEALYNLNDPLGYLELQYLRDALSDYLAEPEAVRSYIEALMAAEAAE